MTINESFYVKLEEETGLRFWPCVDMNKYDKAYTLAELNSEGLRFVQVINIRSKLKEINYNIAIFEKVEI